MPLHLHLHYHHPHQSFPSIEMHKAFMAYLVLSFRGTNFCTCSHISSLLESVLDMSLGRMENGG